MPKNILELTSLEAKHFFLQSESYCAIDLPCYFNFQTLLDELNKAIGSYSIKQLYDKNISDCDDVNYNLFTNKNGRLSWRKLSLINPICYIDLVNIITHIEHWHELKYLFSKFKQEKIQCCSLPVFSENQSNRAAQTTAWWQQFEQRSIELALNFEHLFTTDIADCYGSIYTHSIAWAIHGKKIIKSKKSQSKKERDKMPELLGEKMDKRLQWMQNGQTNGIPQGSVLMDFIAEMVLGRIDCELATQLTKKSITDYYILRYRDDYRIFVNNHSDGEKIIRLLAETLIEYGLQLNSNKTTQTENIITGSIKADKLAALQLNLPLNEWQKCFLQLHQFAQAFPNSGSLVRLLDQCDKQLEKQAKIKHLNPIISIITDIAFHNPKAIPICCAILSKLTAQIDNIQTRRDIQQRILNKLNKMPYAGFAQIWLQRIMKQDISPQQFNEKLCYYPYKHSVTDLWNFNWLDEKHSEITQILKNLTIVDYIQFNHLSDIIKNQEVRLFDYYFIGEN